MKRGKAKAKSIDIQAGYSYPQTMEITLTLEQEAQLSHIAALEGKDAEELAQEVFLRALQAKASFMASALDTHEGPEAAARILELRQGKMLPEGVSIRDLLGEGRA